MFPQGQTGLALNSPYAPDGFAGIFCQAPCPDGMSKMTPRTATSNAPFRHAGAIFGDSDARQVDLGAREPRRR